MSNTVEARRSLPKSGAGSGIATAKARKKGHWSLRVHLWMIAMGDENASLNCNSSTKNPMMGNQSRPPTPTPYIEFASG